ncbi:MAG: hypothetical protein NC079_07000 [Clostridium sp.]|nr:hypothetical protein [Acetatifactor muris]MCM1527841.1 hypothetical protein [Bacteroides sp.]MCM1563341.1 hypothetical protein [Clostridium sp.]
MSDANNRPAWMEDELVRNIPDRKLDLLNQMFQEANARKQSAGPMKSQREMLMLMMPVLKQAKAANLSFTPGELQAAIAAIRKYSNPEELQQIDRICEQHMKP